MVKLTVIASRKAKQSIAVHCQKLDCHGSLRNLAMTAKMPTPRHCGSLPKTGLPRFLRNLAMTAKTPTPLSLRTPLLVIASRKAKQSIAVHCRKLACRGSLRNLAMTAKMPPPRHCGLLSKTGLPRFLTEPCNDSEKGSAD